MTTVVFAEGSWTMEEPNERMLYGRTFGTAMGTVRWDVVGQGLGCAGYALRLVEDGPVTLFDCGPGTLRALAEAELRLESVQRVVISHFHVDHCLDLFALGFARNNPSFEAEELELVSERGDRRLELLILDPGRRL